MGLPRFRLRTLLVAVAIAGLALGWLIERRQRFAKLAALHASRAIEESGPDDPFHIAIKIRSPREEWRMELAAKYERAARYPWLPVEPDPPEPE